MDWRPDNAADSSSEFSIDSMAAAMRAPCYVEPRKQITAKHSCKKGCPPIYYEKKKSSTPISICLG